MNKSRCKNASVRLYLRKQKLKIWVRSFLLTIIKQSLHGNEIFRKSAPTKIMQDSTTPELPAKKSVKFVPKWVIVSLHKIWALSAQKQGFSQFSSYFLMHMMISNEFWKLFTENSKICQNQSYSVELWPIQYINVFEHVFYDFFTWMTWVKFG